VIKTEADLKFIEKKGLIGMAKEVTVCYKDVGNNLNLNLTFDLFRVPNQLRYFHIKGTC
jgi:hypothetical protein